MNDPVNDNESPPVKIITGQGRMMKGGELTPLHILLVAADDDSAAAIALEALAKEGYAEVQLDQIGELEGMPDEEPHASAYQGALEGEVAIVVMR